MVVWVAAAHLLLLLLLLLMQLLLPLLLNLIVKDPLKSSILLYVEEKQRACLLAWQHEAVLQSCIHLTSEDVTPTVVLFKD